MACISAFPQSHTVPSSIYIGVPPSYHSFFYHPMDSQRTTSLPSLNQRARQPSISRVHPTVIISNDSTYTGQGSPAISPFSPISPSQSCDSRWKPQLAPQRNIPAKQRTYPDPFSPPPQPQQPQQHQPKSHSRSYSGDARSHRRNSQQAATQSHFPPTSFNDSGRSPSPLSGHIRSGSSTSSSSPPTSPRALSDALAPVHPLYEGFPRTESGLIPIPVEYVFGRGEIVMTRTTRRLMKTSATGRLTARHPCLILEATESHVRVLQMTSHIHLTTDQVRIVGAQLQHWLAREDAIHQDPFGRPGLQTSPPSGRAGYIWVGDGGEWVPIEQVKYLTGTRVEEREMQRLEGLIHLHVNTCPFKPFSDPSL